jgi:hypothetical protein
MGGTRDIILHYHIFKNAGSTLVGALERNFGKQFAQLHAPQHDQRISGEGLLEFVRAQPDVVAISSHHLSPPAPQNDWVRFHEVLILRHPLDRIRSMFDFYRRAPIHDDPLTIEAKRLDLRDFVEYILATRKHLITNAQTNVIANAGTKIPEREDLSRAVGILRAAAVVGVVEMFDACALQAEHSLRPLFPKLDFSYVRENVTPLRAKNLETRLLGLATACGKDLYGRLLDLNQFDTELVAVAKAESLRRWQEIGMGETQLRRFRRRVGQRRVVHTAMNQYLRLQRFCGRAVRLIAGKE